MIWFKMPSMNHVQLGEYIKAERKRRKMALRELADLAGVSASMLNRLENGQIKRPSQQTLEGVSKGLLIPYEKLDRIARGLSPETSKADGMTPEVESLARELVKLPPDKLDAIKRLLGL